MHKATQCIASILLMIFLVGCGATPGITNTDPKLPNAPAYTYIDTKGNSYAVSQNKLVYDPISADNTIDGVDDEGYHLELNISLNDYAKMAAAFERQLTQTQRPLPANYNGFTIPRVVRRSPARTEEVELSLVGVEELDYIVKPFLDNE